MAKEILDDDDHDVGPALTELVNIQVPTKDEDVLDFTKRQRVLLLESICDGGRIPKDSRDRVVMLQTLADMDRAALSKMKIKSEEGVGANQAAAAAVLAKMLNDTRVRSISRVDVPVAEIPTLPDHVSPGKIVDGELKLGHNQETYDEFMARTNPNNLPSLGN